MLSHCMLSIASILQILIMIIFIASSLRISAQSVTLNKIRFNVGTLGKFVFCYIQHNKIKQKDTQHNKTAITLNVIMLSVTFYSSTECHYADCHILFSAECHYAECWNVECHYDVCCYAECSCNFETPLRQCMHYGCVGELIWFFTVNSFSHFE